MALNLVPPEDFALQKEELHRMLREGVNHHLESPEASVRILGMFVAEVCTKRIHPGGPPLEFSYDKSELLVRKLQDLLIPEKEEDCEVEEFEAMLEKIHKDVRPVCDPRPMVESKFEAPYYIRDLMDMLGNIPNEAEEFEKIGLAMGVHLQGKFALPDFGGRDLRNWLTAAVPIHKVCCFHIFMFSV